MAGKQSAFISGANARIRINSKTLAYCTDVSYNVTIQTIPIETMGTYEVRDNVPVAYTVDGTFSVIRYTKKAAEIDASGTDTRAIDQAAGSGNSPKQITTNDGDLSQHLNPGQLLQSGTFDLAITEQLAKDDGTGSENQNVFTVKDCRITRRGMTLNKRGVYVDQYAYVGILAGDSEGSNFDAANSGVGIDLA